MDEEKIDFRKASSETVYAAKKQVIAQWKAGKKTKEIQANVGLSINIVRKTIREYKDGGIDALKPQKEGRPKGVGTKLTPE